MLLLPRLRQLFTSGQTWTLVAVQQYLIFNEQFPSYVSLCLRLLLTSLCHSASNLLAICVSSYYISRAADSLMATLWVCVCVRVCVCMYTQSSDVIRHILAGKKTPPCAFMSVCLCLCVTRKMAVIVFVRGFGSDFTNKVSKYSNRIARFSLRAQKKYE